MRESISSDHMSCRNIWIVH